MILQVSPNQYSALLPTFPDLPENVHVRYFLTKKLCKVYLTGSISNPQAIIIRSKSIPSELFGYQDPIILFNIIQTLKNWHSILVDNNISKKLGRLLSQTNNITYEKELYFVLKQPINIKLADNTRLLTINDLPLLQNHSSELHGTGIVDSYEEMLSHGMVVGVIIDNQLASIAYSIHTSKKFADVGIFTFPSFRNKGYSTTAASLLITSLQSKNLSPVWSTDENNLASIKVADKLGFAKTYEKTYVNLVK